MRILAKIIVSLFLSVCAFAQPGSVFNGQNVTVSGGGGAALVGHTFVYNTSGGAGGSPANVNMTGANLLVAVVLSAANPGSTAAPSDSGSNTWTSLTQVGTGGTTFLLGQIWFVTHPTVSSTMTFTNNAGGSSVLLVFGYSGAGGGNDGQSGLAQTTNSTTIQPGSITPTVSGDVFVTGVMMFNDTSHTFTINGSFTITDQPAAFTPLAAGASFVNTGTSAQNPTWTLNESQNMLTVMAAFKPGA